MPSCSSITQCCSLQATEDFKRPDICWTNFMGLCLNCFLDDLSANKILYLRNRKHVSCFYRVIETRVEVWENEKCCRNTSRRWVFPQLFQVLPNFLECFYNSIETRGTCFLFHLENTTPSSRQQRMLVLCLHRVIQTRFLTNQRACFLRTGF